MGGGSGADTTVVELGDLSEDPGEPSLVRPRAASTIIVDLLEAGFMMIARGEWAVQGMEWVSYCGIG